MTGKEKAADDPELGQGLRLTMLEQYETEAFRAAASTKSKMAELSKRGVPPNVDQIIQGDILYGIQFLAGCVCLAASAILAAMEADHGMGS